VKQAKDHFKQGFINAQVLQGGVEAWKGAGYALVGQGT
jgi:rhodanese-related sulfurtransferase